MIIRRSNSNISSILSKSTKVTGLALLLLLPVACTKHEIEDHTLQYNQAIGSVGNRLLLLNAVRAAKGYPMQFSKVSAYTGNGRIDGGLTSSFPFALNRIGNPTALLSGSAGPSLNVRSGVSSLQLVDLDTQEAQQALKKHASQKELKYYVEQGWPIELVRTLIFERFAVTAELANALVDQYRKVCERKPDETACWLAAEVVNCGHFTASPPIRGVRYVAFWNNPRNKCDYVRFQWFMDMLRTASGFIDLNPPPKQAEPSAKPAQSAVYKSDKFSIDVNVSVPKTNKAKKTTSTTVLLFANGEIEKIWKHEQRRVDTQGNKIKAIEPVYRSPERMVRYLGDLIAAQALSHNAYEPKIRIDTTPNIALFRVMRGAGLGKGAAVAIKGEEGEVFVIPIPDHGSNSRHRSLQLLALVMDFLNGAISGKDLPNPSPILISSG